MKKNIVVGIAVISLALSSCVQGDFRFSRQGSGLKVEVQISSPEESYRYGALNEYSRSAIPLDEADIKRQLLNHPDVELHDYTKLTADEEVQVAFTLTSDNPQRLLDVLSRSYGQSWMTIDTQREPWVISFEEGENIWDSNNPGGLGQLEVALEALTYTMEGKNRVEFSLMDVFKGSSIANIEVE